jgi:c-di-GMP-related signal transduction protein
MSELAPAMPLREKIREALLGAVICESSLLRWAECCERADWVKCDAIALSYGLNQEEVVQCYEEAEVWAESALHVAG